MVAIAAGVGAAVASTAGAVGGISAGTAAAIASGVGVVGSAASFGVQQAAQKTATAADYWSGILSIFHEEEIQELNDMSASRDFSEYAGRVDAQVGRSGLSADSTMATSLKAASSRELAEAYERSALNLEAVAISAGSSAYRDYQKSKEISDSVVTPDPRPRRGVHGLGDWIPTESEKSAMAKAFGPNARRVGL